METEMKHVTLHAALRGMILLSLPSVILMDANARIVTLEEERGNLLAASEAIVNGLADGVDLTDEQTDTIAANAERVEAIDKQIKALKSVAPQGKGRQSAAEIKDGKGGGKVHAQPVSADSKRGGFKSFGEFAMKVRAGTIDPANTDQRLQNAATTYGNEGTGSDGGFAVPPDFRQEIWQKVLTQENLLTRCAQLTSGSNNVTLPKDETTPWQTSGGVLAYWEGEAQAVAGTKPLLETTSVRLAKLMALVPVSEELLEDAVGLESWLRAKAPMKMVAKINTAIVRGTGVGQPLGFLNAPSVISVAKETSQVAASVYFGNVNKMWSRMYAPCRRNAVWLINQDVEPQLQAMAFDPAATSKVPVYLDWMGGGASVEPYATMKGRPVIPIEACSTVGTQGDINLVDLSQYWAFTKGQDIRTDVSMHLYFDQGLMAFRFTFRVNGLPMWGSAITPENGSNTRSWAVTLDTRS